MRTYPHTAVPVLDTYHILYVGHVSDDGIVSGRRRLFLIDVNFAFAKRCEFWT